MRKGLFILILVPLLHGIAAQQQQQKQVTMTPAQVQEVTHAVSSFFGSKMKIDSLMGKAANAAKQLYVPAYGTERMAELLFTMSRTRRGNVLELGSGFTTPFLLGALHGENKTKSGEGETRVLVTVDDMSHTEHSRVHQQIEVTKTPTYIPTTIPFFIHYNIFFLTLYTHNTQAVRSNFGAVPQGAFQMHSKGWKGIASEVMGGREDLSWKA